MPLQADKPVTLFWAIAYGLVRIMVTLPVVMACVFGVTSIARQWLPASMGRLDGTLYELAVWMTCLEGGFAALFAYQDHTGKFYRTLTGEYFRSYFRSSLAPVLLASLPAALVVACLDRLLLWNFAAGNLTSQSLAALTTQRVAWGAIVWTLLLILAPVWYFAHLVRYFLSGRPTDDDATVRGARLVTPRELQTHQRRRLGK